MECALKLHEWREALYELDYTLATMPDGQKAECLWRAWTANLVIQQELIGWLNEGSGVGPPIHLHVLLTEIINLKDGIPARLLRVDGASLGDNPRSCMRYGWQVTAAVFLRRFMDRDGRGRQKAAAEKIAKALNDAGVAPPGRGDKSYTGRTVEGWLRQANGKNSPLSEDYRKILGFYHWAGVDGSLEEELARFSALAKRMTFAPHDGRNSLPAPGEATQASTQS
jgi:hypothetical protein